MSLANCYCSLQDFTDAYVNGNTLDQGDQRRILRLMEAASRRVDTICHRPFYAATATMTFDGTGKDPTNTDYLNWATRVLFTQSFSFIRIPDLISATSVALDTNSDRVFETVLSAATDYYLESEINDSQLTQPPYTKLQLDIFNATSGVYVFSSRPLLVQIAGLWGYTNATEAVGVTGTIADTTTTTMTVSSASNDLSIGQTLLIDSEQVTLTAGAGTTWTVQRVQNGSTAAQHTAAALNRYVYIPDVREAALIMAGRLWERRKSAYSNVIITPGAGTLEVYRGDDPDVLEMLGPYTRVVL